MSNRFDNGSVSAYTPQSFQELSFTPMMKRAQHDEMSKNLAELDAIATDPLNEHREEALKLKQEFESKLGNISGELASKGIDGIGRENFYRLKKEHDDLIAPTGKIGQINAAKIAEAATKKQFFDSADKKIPQDVLERNWQEHRSKYTGYTDPDKKIISNINSLGSVGYQDLESDIKDKAPLLGETTKTKLRDLGASYEMRPQGMILVTGDGKEITTENSQQLNELGKVLGSKYFNDKGEGYAYNKFAGKDQQNQLDILNNSLKMMIDDKTVKDMNTNYQHINYPEGSGDGENPEDPNNPDSIPEAVTTINSNEELLKGLTNENKDIPIGFSGGTGGASAQGKPLMTKEAQIKSPEYIDLAQKIINQTPSLKGLNTNDQKVINATINYLNTHKNTQTVNRIITPTTSKDTRGYSADEISKYTKMKQDAMETSIRNGMKVFDSEGNLIEKPKSKSIIYNGEYTFNSIVPIKHTNSKTKFAPIAATMVDEDGNEQKVYVEQNPDREKDPLFKAQYIAFQTLNKANKYRGLKQPLKNTFTEENLGLRDVNVIYNDDGSIKLEGKHYNGKNWEKMTPQDFQNDSDFVNHIHNLHN